MALVSAHRGAHGRGGPRHAPENSLDAVDDAVAIGADMVEIDVRRTLDGVYVVNHDQNIGGIPLHRYTYAVLERVTHGRVPTLDEVAQRCAGRIILNAELKEAGYEDRVLDILLHHLRPEELVVTSFRDDVIAACKRAHPEVRAGLLLGSSRPRAKAQLSELFPWNRVRRCGADFIVPHWLLAESLTARAARRGIGVVVWTVNRPERIRRFLLDPRVEAVITDMPRLALELRDGTKITPEAGLVG